jgi:hypothetical protein
MDSCCYPVERMMADEHSTSVIYAEMEKMCRIWLNENEKNQAIRKMAEWEVKNEISDDDYLANEAVGQLVKSRLDVLKLGMSNVAENMKKVRICSIKCLSFIKQETQNKDIEERVEKGLKALKSLAN